MFVQLLIAAAIASTPLAPVAATSGPGVTLIQNKKDVCMQKCASKGLPYQRCVQLC
jgi:hypothetical protein